MRRHRPAVQPLGRLRDRAPDAAAGPVSGHRQGVALASLPGLHQGVGQQRQRARLVLHLPHEQVDQPGLDDQARPGAPAPRSPRATLPHPSHRAGAGRARSAGRTPGRPTHRPSGPPATPATPAPRSGVVDQAAEELRPLGGVVAERERLLALVDHQHRPRTRRRHRRQRRIGCAPGVISDHPLTGPPQRGGDPGTQQRRLTAPGRPDHRQGGRAAKQVQTHLQVRVTTEERLRIVDVVRRQALVRADPATDPAGLARDEGSDPAAGSPAPVRPVPGSGPGRARANSSALTW